jgi:Lrp/AsnC family transcriptional regulator, leucine-responsive regulatory protein
MIPEVHQVPSGDVCQLTTISAPLARLAEVASPSTERVEVDDLDLTLLRALATDARQSQRALARAVGMSPPSVADRLARLERAGAIRGYRVDIDWAALGYPVVVYMAVTAGPGMDLSEIIRAIRTLPEAEGMSVVTGSFDLLVRLRVRDHTHLREMLLSSIFQIPGVQRTETFLSLADAEPDNSAAALLGQMSQLSQAGQQRSRSSDKSRGSPASGADARRNVT